MRRFSSSGGLLLLSLATYLACLPLIGFSVYNGPWHSWKVLTYGWIGMLVGHPAHFLWLANPAVLTAWILMAVSLAEGSKATKVIAVSASGLALVLAAGSLLPLSIVANEGGVPEQIGSREAGYWLWLTSMLAAFAGAIFLPTSRKVGGSADSL
jgi:hypothetical protein